MNTDIQDIYNILLGKHYWEKLFFSLGNLKKEGQEFTTNCPFCQSDRFSISTTKPVWKCWACQESGDYLKYLQLTENKDFKEALLELANEAGVEVNISSNYQNNYQQKQRQLNLYETVQNLFLKSLVSNSPPHQYLSKIRGYQTEIELMGLGSYPSCQQVEKYLISSGFTSAEIKESGLLNEKLTERISIPYPDQSGNICGFSFRSIKDEDKPKYLNTSGLNKDGLVGFQFRPYKPKRILIVEGYFDALLLNSLGLKNYWILALGGTSLTSKQIKVIQDSGVKEILLALDNDNAGKKATMKAIDALRLSKLRVYALTWGSAENIKDPDEFVRLEGIENFSLYLDLCCQSWSEWVAEYLFQQFLIGTQLGNDGYINQCLEIEATINDGLERKLFTTKFLENLKSEGITETDLAQRRQEKLAKTSEWKAKMAIDSLCQDLNKNLKEADFTQSELRIETGLNELKKARGIQLPAPYLADDLLLDISKTGEGLSTGYQDLDNLCLIPQGAITLVSARPSIGKTTFMLNLFLNQIQLYPKQAFYFFSYEESKSRLGVKLIQNLADKVISPQFNHSAYIHYFKTDREQKRFDEGIELGFQKYSELVNSGRLWLLDKRLNDADLVTIINLLGESRHIGAVFIDYVQKIPCSNPSGQDWLNIKNVSQSILDCAVSLDIPIILGCQLNRATESRSNKKPSLGDLRQSGDLEQDANLVLGLYRDEFYNPQTVDTGILEVGILKNRNGKTGSHVKLSFIPETLKITNLSSKVNNDFGF